MRKEEKGKDDKGRVKFRFIEFELDGDNLTIQDALRNITAAVTRGTGATAPARNVSLPPSNEALSPAADSNGAPAEEAAEMAERSETEDTSTDAKPPRRGQPRSPVVLDLDLISVTPSLKDFCDETGSESLNEKYLVIAHWLKNHYKPSIPEVNMDHIHTGFRHMDWQTPADASAPLRQLKQTKYGYFRSGKGKGTFALIHTGENVVSKMGKKEGK